ncbi:NAD(P)H-binding protein [Mucilaginibacter sp. RB4R14]|uniref:NAD(P)-dependent oxidoreductase n=1 Tax=Mucilaginibacter aurantiaciroseus TaxID=2949308 RepID=UPI0020913CA6|nr:NAD(P)H-binding protein [Mucilaginibacter aurantiaciroseus]MCO5936261.1 NAD(P)H-binding protein [Mucilaginibacter aurantiaciroseus]
MKILLLGATGRTGILILEQLIQRGHSVNILVRDRRKVKLDSEAVNVFEGSTLDINLLGTAMKGCCAVISALNISRKNDFPWSALRTPPNLLSATMKNVIKLLGQFEIKRVIIISAWGVNETRKDIPAWFRLIIDNSNIAPAYTDHALQEATLAATDLYWTAIRPVVLTNFSTKKVKVSIGNKPKPGLLISRKSVATFAVDILEQAEFIGLSPVIFN